MVSRKKTKDISVFFLQSEAKDLHLPILKKYCGCFAALSMTENQARRAL